MKKEFDAATDHQIEILHGDDETASEANIKSVSYAFKILSIELFDCLLQY